MSFRSNDPSTSVAASASLNTAALEGLVLDVIRTFPDGCIADEVEKALPQLRLVSISPRFRPLMNKGLIVDTGERRMAVSGRKQRVMKAVNLT